MTNALNRRAGILNYPLAGELWMQKYEIIIYWSDEDRAFVADVPELPGCVAHGDSEDAAQRQAKEAIRLWIDTAREFGNQPLILKDAE